MRNKIMVVILPLEKLFYSQANWSEVSSPDCNVLVQRKSENYNDKHTYQTVEIEEICSVFSKSNTDFDSSTSISRLTVQLSVKPLGHIHRSESSNDSHCSTCERFFFFKAIHPSN